MDRPDGRIPCSPERSKQTSTPLVGASDTDRQTDRAVKSEGTQH